MSSRFKILGIVLLASAAAGAVAWFALGNRNNEPRYKPRPKGSLAFHRDIEPIIRERCVSCHRPGQSGPFNLISYDDVRKRTKQIAEVTASRYMPPWLPEPGHGDFIGERRLTVDELGRIQQWIAEGAPEGPPGPPQPPVAGDEWQLGKPDLVVTLPQPYLLDATGKDVYRNVIAPVPPVGKRFVRAYEFKPNSKTVHHAFLFTDRNRQSRRMLAKSGALDFEGMDTPPTVDGPSGFFASWQPGKQVSGGMPGLSWVLGNASDLLLQLHMKPSGKPEPVQPSIGLYFTDEPPTNQPFKIALTSMRIDIPAGVPDYLVEDSYTLPTDVDVIGVLPHAHYLCREMRGFATLPNGKKEWLIWIRNWDFNWQGDYRYKQPLLLLKGTQLQMQFVYDNTTNNVRNPNSPPKRVQYGVNSTDEMGELWLQLLPRNRDELNLLAQDYSKRVARDRIDYNNYRLRLNPDDPRAHTALGSTYLMQGRTQEAYRELRKAIQLGPEIDDAHYYLGLLLRQAGNLDEARGEFETTIRLSPENGKAHGNLALVLMQLNELGAAEVQLREALRMNPEDAIAHDSLGLILIQAGRSDEGAQHIREAVRLEPENRMFAQHAAALNRPPQ